MLNAAVITWPGLSPQAKLAWHQLEEQLGRGGAACRQTVTSAAAIAAAQGASRWAGQRILRDLEEAGLIEVLEREHATTGRPAALRILVARAENRGAGSPAVRPAAVAPNRGAGSPAVETPQPAPRPGATALGDTPPANVTETAGDPAPRLHLLSRARAPGRPRRSVDGNTKIYRSTVGNPLNGRNNGTGHRGAGSPAVDPEKRLLDTIGATVRTIMATQPTEREAKVELARQIRAWLKDDTLHASITDRAAEAVILDQWPYGRLARVLADVEAMRASLRKPAGALFITLCRKNGLPLGVRSCHGVRAS